MATITTFTDAQVAQDVPNGILGVKYAVLNFEVTPVAAGDVVQALKVDAGQTVYEVQTRVITAEGATCTATVGDASGANSWDASVNLNAAAGTGTRSAVGTDAYATTGKLYAAADTIDLTMGHDTDAAIIEVTAFYQRNTAQLV